MGKYYLGYRLIYYSMNRKPGITATGTQNCVFPIPVQALRFRVKKSARRAVKWFLPATFFKSHLLAARTDHFSRFRMYVITVLFSIRPEHSSEFLQAMVANARTSVAEESGCRQFDVCVSDRNPNDVFLYEVYDSKAAFDAHLASAHFRQFNESTAAWITARDIQAFEKTYPHGGN